MRKYFRTNSTLPATMNQAGNLPRRRHFLLLAGAVCALGLMAGQAHANPVLPSSWEVGGEFDDGNVTSGVWSYGWTQSLSTPFNLDGSSYTGTTPNTLGWQKSSAEGLPLIVHNTLMVPNTYLGVTFPARGLTMHPGASCEWSTLRFTAPAAATYRISGQFYGLDGNGSMTNTKVRILHNNTSLFGGSIDLAGNINAASFTTKTAFLNAGDTIDFKVGCGPNHDYFYGSTGLHAVIQTQTK